MGASARDAQHHPTLIAAIRCGRALNTHLEWTADCEVRLSDGRRGCGTAPRGETPSIYERRDAGNEAAPETVADLIGTPADQGAFDSLLMEREAELGRGPAYALSVALFEALWNDAEVAQSTPRLLFNLLNGGLHAYTNPVRADVTEVLLVQRTDDLEAAVDGYRSLLGRAKSHLAGVPVRNVNGNLVHDLGGDGDDAALRLATDLLAAAGLEQDFGLMVDASAGDWWDGEAYRLPVGGRVVHGEQLVDRWLELLGRYDLTFLEDPFAETDLTSWSALQEARPADRSVFGDNFTSTRAGELQQKGGMVDGVLIKPDQSGTVTGAREFAQVAAGARLTRVVSHRSIETDSPFLIHLALDVGADYVKIGPYSDFSSVLRTNALLRARP